MNGSEKYLGSGCDSLGTSDVEGEVVEVNLECCPGF